MMNSITTRTAQAGDSIYMQTVSPIVAGGAIIVPVNSYVNGVVSNAKPSGRVKGRAELGIRIDTLTLPTGKQVKISPHLTSVDANDSDQKVITTKESEIKQGSSHMKDAARVAILAGSGAAIGALADRSWKGAGIGAGTGSAVGLATVLLTRGPEVELPQGSTFDVVFDRPIAIE
jgi:type IV secretion system protein VirB10